MDPAPVPHPPANTRASEARRALPAVMAALAVMAGGIGFLSYAMLRTPEKPAVDAAASRKVRVAVAPAPAAAVPQPAPAISAASTPAETAAALADASGAAVAALVETGDEEIVEVELKPRLKPNAPAPATAKRAAMEHPPVLTLGQSLLASDDDRPPPFFFASDIEHDYTPPPPPAVAYAGDIGAGPRTLRVALARGETFVDAMRRAGVRAEDRNNAAYAFGKHQNLRALRPGEEFLLTLAEPNQTLFQTAALDSEPESYLLGLDFSIDTTNRVSLARLSDGAFEAMKSTVELSSRLVSVAGRIDGSLFLSAKKVGAPDLIIAELANMFAYDVDFQREILGGDEFEAIFEVRYDENGRLVETGDILYGRLKWRGRTKEKGYYRFVQEGAKRGDYFDRTGESARRLLMKTPIDGARLSSGFGTRKHPIYGYSRAHKGVDFAAPRGTPIKAAGSGVVERAGPWSTFGNYIRIRHASGYKTAYAHLRGFAKGIRAGSRVDQGDIIGYVGTTGASTGPHLHYEVHLNGTAVNPQKLKIAQGVTLRGADLEKFKAQRDLIDAMRAHEAATPDILAQDEDEKAAL
jgi:murein DD-endopeptidase MepM/ murein hydrolase activator NlpD